MYAVPASPELIAAVHLTHRMSIRRDGTYHGFCHERMICTPYDRPLISSNSSPRL